MHSSHDSSIILSNLCHFWEYRYTLYLCVVIIYCIKELAGSLNHTCWSPLRLWVMWIALMKCTKNLDIRDILLSWEYRYTLFAHIHVSSAKGWDVCIVILRAHIEKQYHSGIFVRVVLKLIQAREQPSMQDMKHIDYLD